MFETKPVAIVGMGGILPDASDIPTFWKNLQNAHYSISEVPADRWDPDLYWDPNPSAPDKTYTKIGGWVRDFQFDPFKWGIAIPPRVLTVMDSAQKFAIAAAYQALADYGYPQRGFDPTRMAVILGNALAGEMHYRTTLRIHLPEYVQALSQLDAFKNLPAGVQQALLDGMRDHIWSKIPDITEDTMPGELGNIIAGRIANVFNFAGPNYITDAACASSLAAIQAAIGGLNSHHFDAALTGGVDRNMGVEGFVKFCKIGALSPDGTRPYADGANGFVMGEGAAIFLLKRLADAERDNDKIYAVIRAVGGSSDGKGKGITAPNPLGQQRAIERAWKNAGISPAAAGLIEGHGTSTRVGDVVEVSSLNAVFEPFNLPVGSIALGSVKSNIGHLKSAAGAAGVLKVALALYHKELPPSANFHAPNPNIDFAHLPFYVINKLRPWEKPAGKVRQAGVSSFGFGGTNFHMVMEEWVPGLLTADKKLVSGADVTATARPMAEPAVAAGLSAAALFPYRGIFFAGARTTTELKQHLLAVLDDARRGVLPPSSTPTPEQLRQVERLAIDYEDAMELVKHCEKALKGFENDTPASWQALTAHGIYRGSGCPGKVAFLFPGQGSQYVNMLKDLRNIEPLVEQTFREADEVMSPILGRPLTHYIYAEVDEESQKQAEAELRNTIITQPAVLTTNVALLRVLEKFGYKPDLVMGHSLGEYAALVAAGVLSFPEALQVVSARGREMVKVSMADNGCMAAVSAPLELVEKTLKEIDGYVVLANINSPVQSVIGGSTVAVEAAITSFQAAGLQASKIPVSHAFHTQIVAPAGEPLRGVIAGMDIHPPRIPVVANVTGELYPPTREAILDILAQQVASPVQFVKGIQTLYAEGARVFVEVGPKRVLNALATDNLKMYTDVSILATNHPRKGAAASFNEALCGLYAAGVNGVPPQEARTQPELVVAPAKGRPAERLTFPEAATAVATHGKPPLTGSVVISGAGMGLPGKNKPVFAEDNIQRILRGEIFIEPLPEACRQSMVDKRPVRLVKSDAGAQMLGIENVDQVVKLGGQHGSFDLAKEFGIPQDRVDACDISTQLAIAAGIDALRDAGIPLVMNYRRTSRGSYLPNRWMLPEALADETGVIFASAFPGLDRMAEEAERYYEFELKNRQIRELENLREMIPAGQSKARQAIDARLEALRQQLEAMEYHFDRTFVFRVLSMGHSQFAEQIGARGPNTHVNAACATTTQALAVAEDWIRGGRCRRVIVIAGDDVTRQSLVSWIGTGMLASGATTTEGDLRMAVLPFDRRRNGMIMGMGAAALVVESEDAVRERGMRGICEILASQIANSAYHGTRLDVDHVGQVMDRLVHQAEERFGIRREIIAPYTVFVSHETYTPARGGSASAEIRALRHTFGDQANRIIIANTKGYTGHTMGVGVEDVVAVKALEHSIIPAIANLDDLFEPDPDLGDLNLARGGRYDVWYALRLGAGFGSQIAMTLLRKIPGAGERVNRPVYEAWLAAMSGYEHTGLEVVQHTLRIRQAGPPVKAPASSTWNFGCGPTAWADYQKDENAVVLEKIPAPASLSTSVPMPQVSTPVIASLPVGQAITLPVAAHPVVGAQEEIKAYVLSVVSEKTGYPVEMLDLELDLEADLGIDTVKQAELFATVRTHYAIPRREDLRLSDYNTLAKVIRFIEEALENRVAVQVEQPPQDELEEQRQDKNTGRAEAASSILRRVPVPVLRPRIDLCTPTGVELEAGARVLVVAGQGKAGELLARRLQTRQVQALFLKTDILEELEKTIAEHLAQGPVKGVYFLPGLDVEPLLRDLKPETWQAITRRRLVCLYTLMRALPAESFLVCGTRFGGLHGYGANGATAPLGGVVSGFAKALSRERPQALVKVVDFDINAGESLAVSRLIEETLRDPAVVEVGWENEQRFTITLMEQPAAPAGGLELGRESVFMVSGGTGGIIAPILVDLAEKTSGRFYLLGRSPLPSLDDPDVLRLQSDREGLRKDWMSRMAKKGSRPTPVEVEQRIAALERSVAAVQAMGAIERAGGKVVYLTCDVTDSGSVERVVNEVKAKEGHLDVLIHAAGVERSRKLENKPLEEFLQIFSVKADGFFNLFYALRKNECLPRASIAFSSVAGRLGNAGQTDYSAANDLLARMALALRCQYPEMQALVIDWGAWAEVGMASRGNIPRLMELAGIEMMKPADAAPRVYRELRSGACGEIILSGSIGSLTRPRDENGGLDIEQANKMLVEGKPVHTMFSRVNGLDLNEGVILEADLDPQAEQFLKDHAINGVPVLPGVMGIEGFSAAARHISSVLGSARGSFQVQGLEDIRFLAPFKFYRNEKRRITWKAQVVRQSEGLMAYVTLESNLATRRIRPAERVLHFSGRVHLVPAGEALDKVMVRPPHWNGSNTISGADIYRLFFHGPSFQVLEGVQLSGATVVGKLRENLPPLAGEKQAFITRPALVELCLQTAGVWEISKTSVLALPESIGSLVFYQVRSNDAPIFAEVLPRRENEQSLFDARVMDAKGRLYLELKDYRTSPLPYAVEPELLKPLKKLLEPSS